MQYAIISDIHSNLEALTTALEHIDSLGIEHIICLGDVVGYGANPNECVEIVRQRCEICLKGNHDNAALDLAATFNMNSLARDAAAWTHRILSPASKKFLLELPMKIVLQNFTAVHSSPDRPEEWTYLFTRFDAEPMFDHFSTPVCFIGHTHRAVIFSDSDTNGSVLSPGKHIVNVGSIGQPRDSDRRLSYGFFDTETLEYTNFRLEYDVDQAAQKIVKAGLPHALADRLQRGM